VPRARTTTRLPTADRRDEIVRAARKLFAERGYDGTSIEDIGAAVGLTGPALYRHFKNKPTLFVATFAGADEISEAAIALAVGQDAEEAMQTILRLEATVAVTHREAMLIWQRERNRMPRRTRRENADRRERLYARMEQCLSDIRPDLDEDEVAELRNVLTSIALGAADQQSVLADSDRIDFMVAAGWTLIRGARRSGAAGIGVSGARR